MSNTLEKLCSPPLLALVMALGTTACSKKGDAPVEQKADDAPVAVETAAARVVDRPRTLELTGTLGPNRQANLSPEISGHVAEVLVERGSVVEAGDPLVVLEPGDFKLMAKAAKARAKAQLEGLGLDGVPAKDEALDDTPSVTGAKADWDAARDRLARVKALYDRKAADEQTYVQAQAAEQGAKSRYDAARQQVRSSVANYQALRADAAIRKKDADSATLRAPFAGAVMRRSVEVGEFIGPQNAVVQLVDASKLRLELDVPERYAEEVKEGQTLDVAVDGTDKTVQGTIRFVAAALDMQRRTLTIEAIIDNDEGQLRAGHFGRAKILIGGTQKMIEVPANALVERAGVYRVYVTDGKTASARIVDLIERDGDIARIEGEIADGDAVIIEPGRDVADGVPVKQGSGASAGQEPAAEG